MSPNSSLKSPVIFCDFDGTITAVETFVGMLKTFAPELSTTIISRMYARELTLREGVRQLLESIPTKLYPEMIAYADDKPIRPGLKELLDFCDQQNLTFRVVSAGLKDMVKQVLQRESLMDRMTSITAVEVETNQDHLLVPPQPFEGDTELVAKVKVMEHYGASLKIAIGDSVTDRNMALAADIVFARDRLITYLEEQRKPYIPWNDFFDIREQLQNLLQGVRSKE